MVSTKHDTPCYATVYIPLTVYLHLFFSLITFFMAYKSFQVECHRPMDRLPIEFFSDAVFLVLHISFSYGMRYLNFK